jgi:hypothetical protein
MGVYYSEPVSDTLSALTASILFVVNIPRILKADATEKDKTVKKRLKNG